LEIIWGNRLKWKKGIYIEYLTLPIEISAKEVPDLFLAEQKDRSALDRI